jgi:hypothetical protein
VSQLVQQRWDAKLVNWALWIVGQSSGVSAPDREWWNHPPRPPQPLVGEALDTDELLSALASEDIRQGLDRYQAVRAWYVWTGSVSERAASLRIHPDTLLDRVRAARYRLEDLDQARRRDATRPPAPPPLLERDTEGTI